MNTFLSGATKRKRSDAACAPNTGRTMGRSKNPIDGHWVSSKTYSQTTEWVNCCCFAVVETGCGFRFAHESKNLVEIAKIFGNAKGKIYGHLEKIGFIHIPTGNRRINSN
jgi:hypothetical protein